MKMSRVKAELHAFSTSAIYGGELSASRTGRSNPVPIGLEAGWVS